MIPPPLKPKPVVLLLNGNQVDVFMSMSNTYKMWTMTVKRGNLKSTKKMLCLSYAIR